MNIIEDKDFSLESEQWFQNHLNTIGQKKTGTPKKKKTKRTNPEYEIQKRIVTYLKELKTGGHILNYYAIINESNHLSSIKASLSGMTLGVSDLVIILNDGFNLFLELKKDRPILKSGKISKCNYQSNVQETFEQSINVLNNKCSRYHITYGYKESSDIIHKYVVKHK